MTLGPQPPISDVRNDALRLLSNGLYVLTSCDGDRISAVTVSWVTQVSFQPLLILVALRRNSHVIRAARAAHRFALNILDDNQLKLAEAFFDHLVIPEGSGLLNGYGFRLSEAHCPLLTDALAWVECRLAAEPESPGDHELVLGEVTGAGVRRDASPMVLRNTPWSYGTVVEV